MHVAMIKFSIRLPENESLKGKRRVVRSLCQKLRNHFEVSVAEVANNDDLRTAVIGISFVSNSIPVLHQIISNIMKYLQASSGDFILLNFEQNIVQGI